MKDIWNTAFVEPMQEFFRQVGSFLPHLLAMLLIVAIGIVVAWMISAGINRLLRTARFDQFSGRVGFTQALSKGGIREAPSHLIGRIFYWVIVLAFFMLGLSALQLPPVDRFVDQVVDYLPHLLVAATIILAGLLLANFFATAALIAAVNAQVVQARLIAQGVRVALLLLALAMALEQLGIAPNIIVAAFSISFGGAVLALAIAFGLGAKDAAKVFLEQRLKKERPKEEEFSHL
ncbi:MAG TPA: hypothetical protein VEI24_07090 [Nitrospiria bacterium]|nr:hypothetical protein [Nitrospiria bacterium]